MISQTMGGRIRLGVLCAILLGLCLYFHVGPILYYLVAYTPQEGDIVFQALPHMPLVDAIEGISQSPYSHCGVVVKDQEGNWKVLEAIGDVHEVSLYLWVIRGRSGGFCVYRLKPEFRPLIPEMVAACRTYIGKPYDYDYDMSDDAIYCSELVYKGFRTASHGGQLGKLQALGDLNWKPYEKIVREIESNRLPLDRLMITPVSLSKAPQLEKVFSDAMPDASSISPPDNR